MREVIAAAVLPVVMAGCCPVPPGGPTATGVTQTMSLVAGARHFFDVDVPADTTQLNVDLRLERSDVTLRLPVVVTVDMTVTPWRAGCT
jgi:hypothetical protein